MLLVQRPRRLRGTGGPGGEKSGQVIAGTGHVCFKEGRCNNATNVNSLCMYSLCIFASRMNG